MAHDYRHKLEAEQLAKEMEKQTVEVVTVPEEAEEEEPIVFSVDFEKLHEINPDIYAWLIVPGTDVSYPIVQSPEDKDTDYYLTHNLDGSEGYPGGIYTQKRNTKDFSDPDTIIYGHNMKNGTMFATIHYYEDEDFFKEHPYMYIITEDKTLVYQVFAAIWYDDRLVLDYFNDFQDPSVFEEYLNDLSNWEGIYDADRAPTKEDKIVTLATCIKVRPNERFHVIGRLLSPEEVKQISDEDLQGVADALSATVETNCQTY